MQRCGFVQLQFPARPSDVETAPQDLARTGRPHLWLERSRIYSTDLGDRSGWLLLAWRIYTNGLGVVLGVVLAAHVYGWPVLRRLARRWSDRDGARSRGDLVRALPA